MSIVKCPSCESQDLEILQNGAYKCKACSAIFHHENPIQPQTTIINNGPSAVYAEKSKVAAILLCFFLGSLGIHSFYLGKVGAGILSLLFCWTFIPAFIAFIQFIMLLCMSDAEFRERYCRIR